MTSPTSTPTTLIQIHTDQSGRQTVDARELHFFLESRQEFAHWIKNRIKKFSFVEGVDFIAFDKSIKAVTTYINTKEYHLSIDMAKELSMVERNEKGKQARQYFIECERRARAADPMAALNDPATMRDLLLSYTERVLFLEQTVSTQKPKVEAFDRIANADGYANITTTAKTLQMRPKDLFSLMSRSRWIYRRPGGKCWLAYQDKIQTGYLTHKVATIIIDDNHEKTVEQVLITPKGLAKLAEMVEKEAA